MRGFSVSIYDDYLAKGLRPDFRSNRRKGFLEEAYNVKVNKEGLVPYIPVIMPFSQGTLEAHNISFNWPQPQLYKGYKETFLLDRTRIFKVFPDYTLSEYEVYDYYDQSSPGNILPGNQWQVVDLHDAYFFHNGTSSVFHTGRERMLGEGEKMFVVNAVRIQAGCYFRGRTWIGGFDDSFYWTPDWETFWNDWSTRLPSSISYNIKDLSPNFVWWSTIGGGDTLFIFDQGLGESGNISSTYGSSEPIIFDYLLRNECGWMPMPWQGRVLTMKPLGDGVMVYGEGGCTLLLPQQGIVGSNNFEELSDGLHNAGAVGGDDREHVFMDNTGCLWYINRSYEVVRLGYREYMNDMVGNEVIISFDKNEREWYISDGYKAFIYTKGGLTEHSQIVTSVINSDGGVLGFCMDESAMDKSMKVKTGVVDFGGTGIKTLESVHVHGETTDVYAGNMKAFAEVRYEQRGGFEKGDDVEVSDEGFARLDMSANDFKVGIKSDDFRYSKIEDLILNYKLSDRRFRRNLSPTVGR